MNQKPFISVSGPTSSKIFLAFFSLIFGGAICCVLTMLFMPTVVLVVGQILVYTQADTIEATVTEVTATNKSCIDGISIPCTHFLAQVTFNASGETITTLLDMGHVRGYNQPVSEADYPPGTTMTIRYNPRNPTQVSYHGMSAFLSIELVMFILSPLFFLLILGLSLGYRINSAINYMKRHAKVGKYEDWRSH